MSRSRRTNRKPRGCGPRYCWCCDAKRCDHHTHDQWGAIEMRELGDPSMALLHQQVDEAYIDDEFRYWPEMDRK